VRALYFDGQTIRPRSDYPEPALKPGWAVIRVRLAGICRTDLELAQGYMGFQGVLGHEFVGEVARCEDETWLGRRVVGEINAACDACAYEWCRATQGRHCPRRSVLGILHHDGCFADYCTLPASNLHAVPSELSDEQAVFTEPLSAAYEILEQVDIGVSDRCVVLGDGKLGILCAWVLRTVARDVTLLGHHERKLQTASWDGLKTASAPAEIPAPADVVVDATGSGSGIQDAMRLCRPRGTLVLKSTVASQGDVHLAPIVIDELQVVGSRCGRFEQGLSGLVERGFPVERLIERCVPLAQGRQAFAHALERGALKILLTMN